MHHVSVAVAADRSSPSRRRALLFILLFTMMSPAVAQAQRRSAAELTSALDSAVLEAVNDGFSGQVLAVAEGNVVLHRGYGAADPSIGLPVDTATVFPIGSVSKRFTRVAILKLQEEGALSTSDPVSRWVEGLPEDKRGITLDQLLSMRAGLEEYHDDSGDHQPMSKEEAIRRIGDQELLFEPGTDEAYSNSSYTLLAVAVESASGRTFETYLREEVFEPAGMERTGFHGDSQWPDDDVARGQGMRTFRGNAPNRWPTPTWALKGAGGIVAPAADLLRFITALRGGRIVGPEALAELFPEGQPDLHYAGGDDFGFVTHVMELDSGRHVVVISTNRGYEYERLPLRLARIVRGEPVAEARGGGAVDEDRPVGGGTGERTSVSGGDRQEMPDSPRGRVAGILMSALEDGSKDALRELVQTSFTGEMREAVPMEDHLAVLGQLGADIREHGVRGVRPLAELRFAMVLGNGDEVVVDITAEPPHRIEGMRLGG